MVNVDFKLEKIFFSGQEIGRISLNEREKFLVLNEIRINPEFQKMGYAQEAMLQIIDYSDKLGKILALTPSSDFGSNKNKLIEWYKSLGFVMNKGRNKNYETMELMFREPQTNVNEVIRREIWSMNEMVENVGYLAFHGSPTKINGFSNEFIGAEDAIDQEGPGIYFTTSYEDAEGYAGNNGFVHTVKLSPRKLLDESSSDDVNIESLIWLIKQADDWESLAQNWSEDPESGAMEAAQGAIDYNEKEKDVFVQIWVDFFRYDSKTYADSMIQLGIDGIVIDKMGGNDRPSKHIIVYNPQIIEIREVEQSTNESVNETTFQMNNFLDNATQDTNVRDGGYAGAAMIPQSVSEDDMIDDNSIKIAIKYLSEFDINKISDLRTKDELNDLYKNYLIITQNINRGLEISRNEIKLFDKLIIIQNFLKQENIINEDLVYWGVDDASPDSNEYKLGSEGINENNINEVGDVYNLKKDNADNIANQVSKKLNFNSPKYIGEGNYGYAYDAGNVVIKVTVDKSEAVESFNLKGQKNEHIADIYNVFNVGDKDIFVIVLEKLDTNTKIMSLYNNLDKIFKNELNQNLSFEKMVIDEYIHNNHLWDKETKFVVDEILNDHPNEKQFFNDVLKISNEASQKGIRSVDFVNPHNLGYKKNGKLGFFDIGRGEENEPRGEFQNLNIDESNTPLKDNNCDIYFDFNSLNKYVEFEKPLYSIINKRKTAKLLNISPKQYIYKIANNFGGLSYEDTLSHVNDDNVIKYSEMMKSGSKAPIGFFSRKNGSQEGRHRALAAMKLGCENMPIIELIDLSDNEFLKIIKFFKNKSFDELNNLFLKMGFKNGITNLGYRDLERYLENNINEDGTSLYSNAQGSVDSGDVSWELQEMVLDSLSNVITERILTWMPKAKEVSVKDKCKLGGNGDGTSTACNQGDISNLDITNIQDENTHKPNEPNVAEDNIKDRHYFKNLNRVIKEEIKKINTNKYGDKTYLMDINKDEFIHFTPIGSVEDIKKKNGLSSGLVTNKNFGMGSIFAISLVYGDYIHDVQYPKKFGDEEIVAIRFKTNIKPNVGFVEETVWKNTEFIPFTSFEIISVDDAKNLLELSPYKIDDSSHVVYNVENDMTHEGKNIYLSEFINEAIISNSQLKEFSGKNKSSSEINQYVSKFNSSEELLRNGGIPIDLLDKAAHGFTEDSIKQLMPDKLKIKWHDDLDNVKWEINKKGISDIEYANSVDLSKPIDVSYSKLDNGEVGFYIEDGHHRYYAAKILNKPLNVNLEIKINPFTKLSNLGYDEYHRFIWKQAKGVTQESNNTYSESMIQEANIMSLKDLPFKQEIDKLGGKIFSVGGAVRDEFLGKESKDLDILITGVPFENLEQLLKKHGRVDAVGKSFGVIKFIPNGSTDDIDIAIPRTEKKVGDGHQGFDVTSDHNLPIEDDLKRRDFTINAIAKDIDGNLIDPFGGQQDLSSKIIKVVNPEAFGDDPLRMLRAVQFASRFGFTIEPNTMKLIQHNAPKIKEIAGERMFIELEKIVTKGDKRVGAQLLKDTGLFQNMFDMDLKQSSIDRSPFEDANTMGEFMFLLTRLLPNPSEVFRTKLKGDISTVKEIEALTVAFNDITDDDVKNRLIAHNIFNKSPNTLNSLILPDTVKKGATDLTSGRYPKNIKELDINGNDLMGMGLKGKEIGNTLDKLLINIYGDKLKNNNENLVNFLINAK